MIPGAAREDLVHLSQLLFSKCVRRIDLQRSREFRSRGFVILFLNGAAAPFEALEGGGVSRLFVFEPVFDITGVAIERGLVLGHRRLEIPLAFGVGSPVVRLAGGATSSEADRYNSGND